MADGSEHSVSKSVAEWVDHLATQLMLHGEPELTRSDLTHLHDLATAEGRPAIAERAAEVAVCYAGEPEQTSVEFVTGLIAELRVMLKDDAISLENTGLDAFAADPEMVAEFITEAREHLVAVEEKMLLIEAATADMESINAVFRAFHTIKGLAGFLELDLIQQVAHEVETLLDLARAEKLTVSSAVVDAVFEAVDYIRTVIASIEAQARAGQPEPAADNELLLLRIRNAGHSGLAPEIVRQDSSDPAGAANPGASDAVPVPASQPVTKTKTRSAISPSNVSKPDTPPIERRTADGSSVRIETAKLDHLMNMVGEMVIAQTLISHSPSLAAMQDSRLVADIALLTRITSDVQKVTTSMRMVPIGMQFQKTARLVRDLSRQEGKQVALVTSGEETELDKAIAEELADPMMHMVRNSIDHGIERPAARELSGKAPTAQIRLAAYHQSGQIVIEISDDGRGLDREKILAKATERGLVRPGNPNPMSDSEVFLLIFEPGFSTAETVTGISGRGVGMDVVKKHVQKLRGRIDIQSEQGKGATFFLKLPLTLAIIEGLIVVVGESRYIVPIFSIIEMLRPTESLLSTVQGKAEMALVRGSLLPIIRLHERFKLEPRSRVLTDGMLVVCESQDKQFCLFVDDLMGKQEVVIKSLGEMFKDVAGLAGCAILGDGRVGLILDVEGIFRGRP